MLDALFENALREWRMFKRIHDWAMLHQEANRVAILQDEFARNIDYAFAQKDRRKMIESWRELKAKAGASRPAMQSRQVCRPLLLKLFRHLRTYGHI